MHGTMMDIPLTLDHLVDRAERYFPHVEIVSRRPDKTVVRSNYLEVCSRARKLAAALIAAGLRPGDRVATLMWNHAQHLEAYLCVPLAGGVVHTLNLRLHPDEIAYIANHAEDRFLIVDDVLLPVLETFRSQVRFERIWVVPFSGKTLPAGVVSYEDLLSGAPASIALPPLDENQAAAMCYTSGTTGRSKGVLYSHRALVLHSFAISLPAAMGFSERDVVMQVSSMFHANGWGFPYAATMVGAKLVFPGPQVDCASLLELIEAEGVTVANGVPTIWIGVADALDREPQRWKRVAGLRVLSAGSAVPQHLFRALDRHGVSVLQAWGMTETTPLATFSHLSAAMLNQPADAQLASRAKQGRPVPFVMLRATNLQGEIPWDGHTLGELEVRGPWVASSYHHYPESSDRWTPDGWFRTGDVVSIDPDGTLKIADRSKDLIKSGGEWISSVDLENALMSHPGVLEAVVVGVPHPKWQERPLAVVVPRGAAKPSAEELRAFLSSRFAKWQLPDAFVFSNEIPKTSVGKFLKTQLREQYSSWKWDEK